MNEQDGTLSFATAIDVSGLQKGISDIERKIAALDGKIGASIGGFGDRMHDAGKQVKDSLTEINNAGMEVSGTFGLIAKGIAAMGIATTAQAFVSQLVSVRGEFQKLEVSFKTMLGSADKADILLQELTRTAATTPFDLQSVADGARQLLSYGEDVSKVNEDLVRLGNIASGLSIPLGDIVYLYGTTMTQGRIYSQDLNQFTGRGIPMVRELASVLGVAECKVKEMVESGKVGFPEVQKAIYNLTNEGGMFFNLMQEQSKTIGGQISNIQDSISTLFNEVGKQQEGIINDSLAVVSSLVENYEQVGRSIAGLAVALGGYKAACIAVAAAQAAQTSGLMALTTVERVHYGWLVLTEKTQKLLNATMLTNPFVLIAASVAAMTAALIAMRNEEEMMRDAEEAYQDTKQKTLQLEDEHIRKMKQLCDIAGEEAASTETRRTALVQLEQKYPSVFDKYDTEYDKLKNIKKIKEEIAELEGKKSIGRTANELQEVSKRIAELEKKKKNVSYVSMNTAAGAQSVKVGGISAKENAELRNLLNKRNELEKKSHKENVDAYLANLTGISNKQLEAQINVRKKLLASMDLSDAKYGRIKNTETAGTYTQEELQGQLQILESERKKRGESRVSSSGYAKQAKKTYDDALKAYNDFLASKNNAITKSEYEAKRKELKDVVDLAKKEYDATRTESRQQNADKSLKQQEQNDEKALRAKEQAAEQLRALLQQNVDAEIDASKDGLSKRLSEIDNNWNKQKDKLKKQQEEWIKLNKESGVSVGANGLTDAQNDAIEKAYTNNNAAKARLTAEAIEADKKMQDEAMNDYYVRYGNMQEKIVAITKQYNSKIADAKTEGEKMSLQKELEHALEQLNIEQLKSELQLDKIFSDLDSIGTEALVNLSERLKEFIQANKDLSPENMRELVEALERINKETNERSPFESLSRSVKKLKTANKELKDAQDAYDISLKVGTKGEQEAAKATLNAAKSTKQKALNDATKAKDAAVNEIEKYLDTAMSATDSLESMGVAIPESIKGAMSGLSTTLDGLASIDFTKPLSVVSGGLKAMSGIVGLGSSLFGSDNREWERLSEQYDGLEKMWDRLISKKQEYINTHYGNEVSEAVNEVKELYEAEIKGLESVALARLKYRKSSDHSVGYNMWKGRKGHKGYAWKDIADDISQMFDMEFNGMEDLITLTSSQWEALVKKYPEYVANLDDDFKGYIEEMHDKAQAIEDAVNQETERLTGFTEDSILDWFMGELRDMDMAAEDFADNFQKRLMEVTMNAELGETYRKRLEDFLKKWKDDTKSDNELSGKEAEELQSIYQDIVNDAIKERDELANLIGYKPKDDERKGTSNGIATASQESVDENNARLTTIQAHTFTITQGVAELNATSNAMLAKLTGIETNTHQSAERLSETLSQVKQVNNTLEEIKLRGIKIT